MSPRQTDSHRLMIDAMRSLALTKGYGATTVDEVCDEAGVSKGSFYHHFASKEEIATAAVDAYFTDLVEALADGPYVAVDDPVDRLHQFVQHAAVVCHGPIVRQGCLLGSFALDLAETHPALQADLSFKFSQLAATVAELIADAATARAVALDAEQLARHFLTVLEGSIVLAKAHGDLAIITAELELFGSHLELLLA